MASVTEISDIITKLPTGLCCSKCDYIKAFVGLRCRATKRIIDSGCSKDFIDNYLENRERYVQPYSFRSPNIGR